MNEEIINYIEDPNNDLNNFNLALWYHKQLHYSPACSFYLRCAELTEAPVLAYECLLNLYCCYKELSGRNYTCENLLKSAINLGPKYPEAYFLLSQFYEAQGNWMDCYLYASLGLENTDCLPTANMARNFGYEGKYCLIFQKAVSSWWYGKPHECRNLFISILSDYYGELNPNYKAILQNNLSKLGIGSLNLENISNDCLDFEKEYLNACVIPSDINENLHILHELAKQCKHVTEFGVRTGVSTRAFLNTDVTLRSYDLDLCPMVSVLFENAKKLNKDVSYAKANDLEIEIEETDLLFIDTWHSYNQVKEELKKHACKVKKYIVFHDTHTYGTKGEDDNIGLLPALIEFMINNPEWKFHTHKTNNNGMTVIEKS